MGYTFDGLEDRRPLVLAHKDITLFLHQEAVGVQENTEFAVFGCFLDEVNMPNVDRVKAATNCDQTSLHNG